MTFWGPQILLEDQSTILQIKPLISLNALTTATTLTGTVYVTKTSRELQLVFNKTEINSNPKIKYKKLDKQRSFHRCNMKHWSQYYGTSNKIVSHFAGLQTQLTVTTILVFMNMQHWKKASNRYLQTHVLLACAVSMPETILMDFPQATHQYRHADQTSLTSVYISHQRFYPEIET